MFYYAVHKGFRPGVYSNWNTCKKNVIGFKGAVYKKFDNEKDAMKFYKNGKSSLTRKKSPTKKTQNQESKFSAQEEEKFKKADKIYTDGSLIRKNKIVYAGYGIYIPSKNKKISKVLDGKKTNNRAEMSAIIDAVKLYKKGSYINIFTDSNYSILIFTGTGERYRENNYKRNGKEVPNVDLIKKGLKLVENYKIKFNHVRAHTNEKDQDSIGNDMADQLAVKGAVNDYVERNKDLSNYKMRIGKYKNKKLKEVSEEYLANLVVSPEFKKLCSKNEICNVEREIINNYLGFI